MYKIIYDNTVIDIVRYPTYIKFLKHGHIAITDKTSAQGIVGSDDLTVYSFISGIKPGVKTVSIKEISETEFKRLESLLNSGKIISADESALMRAKQKKIDALSAICKSNITSGFSLRLSDGIKHNFKLTVEDQLNLMMIENQLASETSSFIYHATNQPCEIYNKEDMKQIIKAFHTYVTYHTTYFNIAKQYIKSLVDIKEVNKFTYGTDVSATTDNQAIKQILKSGGNIT